MRSAHVASKDTTATGSLHKSKGERVVCAIVEYIYIVWCVFLLHRGMFGKCVCSPQLCVTML